MPHNRSRKYFNNYKDCISYLFDLERAGIKYDLTNITSLLKFLKDPQNTYPSIHVAGTNGKGSVSSIINSALIESGQRSGLYTSPHILDFRERISVSGKLISKKFIIDSVNRLHEQIQKIGPSFFEVTTAIAFEYFRYKKVDVAVIETGLGGRLDSTNVINPVVSVISGISIDHIEMLGKTVESITVEKGGIIKKDTPVVVGRVPLKSELILKKIAKAVNSKITFVRNESRFIIHKRKENGLYFTDNTGRSKPEYFFPVIGDYQLTNISTAICALEIYCAKEKIRISNSEFKKGLQNVKLNSGYKGRFEKISDSPKIITDISHNLQGIKNIRDNLKYFRYKKLYIIFSMMNDKQYKECIAEIGKLNAEIVLTRIEYGRSAGTDELMASISKNKKKFIRKENVNDSLDYVLGKAKKNDAILITGSFFLVSEALMLLKKRK